MLGEEEGDSGRGGERIGKMGAGGVAAAGRVRCGAAPSSRHDAAQMQSTEEKWLCLGGRPRSDCMKPHTGPTMTF